MYYRVKFIGDDSVADIMLIEQSNVVVLNVISDNQKMKQHLETLLQREFYSIVPKTNSVNFYSDIIMRVYPNTKDYFMLLPDMLSWRGYTCDFIQETHKSFDFTDFENIVLKSTDATVYNNTKGERIVKVVPAGYVAIHNDGRVVSAGRWLNANIDKAGAEWTLVANPYEQSSTEQRQQEKAYMDMGLAEYHPGVHDELYEHRKDEDSAYFKTTQKFTKKPEHKNLTEFYSTQKDENNEKDSTISHTLPIQVSSGNFVFYSPTAKLVLHSSLWKPENTKDFDKHQWYAFPDTIPDDEKPVYRNIIGNHPTTINSKGSVVPFTENVDVSNAIKFRLGNTSMSNLDGIIINERQTTLGLEELTSPEYNNKVKTSKEKLDYYKKLTNQIDPVTGKRTVDKSLDTMEVDGLRGANANFLFEPYGYQKAIINSLAEESQYESLGGPKGWMGCFINLSPGLGKTAVATAADAVLRNRGKLKNGSQFTLVTAPSKNIYVWESEIEKFRGEGAYVIDAQRDKRIEMWEQLIDKVNKGEAPNFVVLSSSKFTYGKKEDEDILDEEDKYELEIDSKYIKLLSLGGKSSDKIVNGNHVGVFVMDESGQFVNKYSNRHQAVQEVLDSLYHSGGLAWTLSADISGNSATDTISQMSFVNKIVRDNYNKLEQTYTTTTSGKSGRRAWRNIQNTINFMQLFGNQIYQLDGRTVAGENFGLMKTEDLGAPLGKNWGEIYRQAEDFIFTAASMNKMNRALGLLSVLAGASFGAVHPARLFDYDLGVDLIKKDLLKFLSNSDDYNKVIDEINLYQSRTTDAKGAIGYRSPKEEGDTMTRDRIYEEVFSDQSKLALDKVLASWNNPIMDSVVKSIENEIRHNQSNDKNLKMGVAGFSKRAIKQLYIRLSEKYNPNKVMVNIVDGDTKPEEVSEIQKRHQNEKEKTVISLVTSAGLYGLSLPADRAWRFPVWNSAKGNQFDGRFHRKAEQKNISTVLAPDGLAQYMRQIELEKEKMAANATTALFADDNSDELEFRSVSNLQTFLNVLRHHRPRILKEEVEV